MRYLPIVVLALVGCEQRKGPGADMKPAESWNAPGGEAAEADPDDPHAALGVGAARGAADDPHAGLDIDHGGDPHAGVDMTGPGGLPAPDPDRPVDPNKFLKGKIALGKGVSLPRAPASAVVFLSVRPADAQGNSAGPPLAVDVLPPGKFPMAFELTEAKAMIGGTAFAGSVLITARLDQDQDVDTRQPGDLSGKIKATIPAGDLVLTLDTVQP